MTKRSLQSFTSQTRLKKVALFGGITGAVVAGGALTAQSLSGDLAIADQVEGPAFDQHVNQATLNAAIGAAAPNDAFTLAFKAGDELFQTSFRASEGVGADVHAGERFTRVPRADQTDSGEWFTHVPARATGPNARSCKDCHFQGASPEGDSSDDGGGEVAMNAARDPLRHGLLTEFIQRNAPHLFGMGALQRLAEEMTLDLIALRNGAGCDCTSTSTATAACSARTVTLTSKGITFGTATISRAAGASACTVSVAAPSGGVKRVDDDLVVKPLQWKGANAFIRDFQRGAGHNEIGMQANELLATDTTDGDDDHVTNELTVGDITALTVYGAAQPRPTTRQELAAAGIIPALTSAENTAINNGRSRFTAIGCASCHTPSLTLNSTIFSEPSQLSQFRDRTFPGGRTPSSLGVAPATAIKFDLSKDIPDNRTFPLSNGTVITKNLGNFTQKDAAGKTLVNLYGDLRRHQLGTGLQEQVDEVGTGRGTFLTENLWGVGSTAPYLHDGRASTLTEAILWHHGEGETARTNFAALTTVQQQEVVAFLNNLVLFKSEAQ